MIKLTHYKNGYCILHKNIENNFYYLKDLKKFKSIRDLLESPYLFKDKDNDDLYWFTKSELKKIKKEKQINGLTDILEFLETKKYKGIVFHYYIPRIIF